MGKGQKKSEQLNSVKEIPDVPDFFSLLFTDPEKKR